MLIKLQKNLDIFRGLTISKISVPYVIEWESREIKWKICAYNIRCNQNSCMAIPKRMSCSGSYMGFVECSQYSVVRVKTCSTLAPGDDAWEVLMHSSIFQLIPLS